MTADAAAPPTGAAALPHPALDGRRAAGRGLGWLPLASALAAAVLALPVLTVAVQAFHPAGDSWDHLAATVLPGYVGNTLLLALMVAAGVLVLGVTSGWLVVMCRFPGRRLFEWALVLPLAVPAYVLAYVYTDLLQAAGPVQGLIRAQFGLKVGDYWFPAVRSLPGAAAMFVLVLYPYVYLLARACFLEQSVCVIEAGRTLGCTPFAAFRRVALPLARPALAGGCALALMETLSDFGTVSYFGVPTFTTGIYRAWYSMGDPIGAARLSAGLLGFVLLLLLLERRGRRQARYHQTSSRYRALPGYTLRGPAAGAAVAACALPVGLGFLLPGAALLRLSLDGDAGAGLGHLLHLAGNSVTLAAATALLAVILALVIAYSGRLAPKGPPAFARWLAGAGYAVPGSVIAVGVLIPFAAFDNAIDGWAARQFGGGTGLILTGGIAALVFALLVRFLGVALQTVEASLAKVTPSMDAAARSLGSGPAATLGRVHAPIMAGSLLTAGLLVFVDVMKELPATLLMRPFNFDTLAVQAYQFAADERLAEAALPSLVIVAAGLLPVILLSRLIGRSRPGHPGCG